MSPKLGAVFDLGFLGVPYPQGTVGRTSGDEMTCGTPGYRADSAGSVNCLLDGSAGPDSRRSKTTYV